MSLQPFTPEERSALRENLLTADLKQLTDARLIATILSDDESNKQDALLALTFYYSLKENKDELQRVMSALMLNKE